MNAILSPAFGEQSFSLDDFPPALNAPPTTMVPLRRTDVFAVIHVDAREVKLLVSRLGDDGAFQTLRQEREVFNFGPRGLENPGQIAVKLAEVLSRFQRMTELLGATLRAVATESFRGLPHYAQLLQRLCRITRVPLRVLSEREAARFVCMGAMRGRAPHQRSVLVEASEETTSIMLASVVEPLGLWRLTLGTSRLATAPGGRARHPDRERTVSWRRQIQDELSAARLEAIRGAAHDVILLRPPAWGRRARSQEATMVNAATAVLLDEVASYLAIRKTSATEAGMNEGILVELSRFAAQ